MDQALDLARSWWQMLGPDAAYYLWLATGIGGLFLWAWLSHRILRRILGHRRHHGVWYNEAKYAQLMQMLAETSRTRVLQHDDMVALRAWQYGDTVKPVFGDQRYGGL